MARHTYREEIQMWAWNDRKLYKFVPEIAKIDTIHFERGFSLQYCHIKYNNSGAKRQQIVELFKWRYLARSCGLN